MLIVFRYPDLEDYKPPEAGELVALDAETMPLQIYLTPADVKAINKMPKGCTSILVYPDYVTKQDADKALRMNMGEKLRNVTRLVPQKGDPDGRAEAQPGL